MKLIVLGSGDAFGSGGRGHTCFLVENAGAHVAVDFGATALVEMKRAGHDPRALDAIVLSHLHGDHFGGIPFLLLDSRYGERREKPLTIVGPVGTAARLRAAQEVFFPGTWTADWGFPLTIVDLPCGEPAQVAGLDLLTFAVVHPSGAPATAMRLANGRVLAYSGDTSWTEALLPAADGADLFIVDCHDAQACCAPHLDLATIEANRDRLGARRIMLTHMGDAVLRRMDDTRRRGFLLAHDGLVLDV